MRARLHFPNGLMMILCHLGAFGDFNKLNAFSDIGVGGVPQRALPPPHFSRNYPACQLSLIPEMAGGQIWESLDALSWSDSVINRVIPRSRKVVIKAERQ